MAWIGLHPKKTNELQLTSQSFLNQHYRALSINMIKQKVLSTLVKYFVYLYCLGVELFTPASPACIFPCIHVRVVRLKNCFDTNLHSWINVRRYIENTQKLDIFLTSKSPMSLL